MHGLHISARQRAATRLTSRTRLRICLAVAVGAVQSSQAAPSAADEVRVQFIVSAPQVDGEQLTEIYCSLSVDQWPAGGRPLPQVAPGLFVATFDLPASVKLEYKFLRARKWSAVEKASGGEELSNRTLTIPATPARQTVIHSVTRWADAPAPPASLLIVAPAPAPGVSATSRPLQSTKTGDVRTHGDFASPQLRNQRTIHVYLPPDYERRTDARYPVLYMHDGQNVFDAATSFQGVEWGMDETAELLIRAGEIPPLIIVAVENTPDRMAEYTCVADARHGGGAGDAYLEFIAKTVKPFVDANYRTQPEREHTAIAGSSLGGLISLCALARHVDVFGRAAAISPALFWADRAVIREFEKFEPRRPVRLWIDMGDAEGGDVLQFSRAVADCDALVETLVQRGMKRDGELHYEIVSGGRHHERDWAARADRMLRFLFTER